MAALVLNGATQLPESTIATAGITSYEHLLKQRRNRQRSNFTKSSPNQDKKVKKNKSMNTSHY
jgi:hypothetical protein